MEKKHSRKGFLRECFLQVMQEKKFDIEKVVEPEVGLCRHLSDPSEPIEDIVGRKGSRKASYRKRFIKNIKPELADLSEKELLEKTYQDKNLYQIINIKDEICIAYEGRNEVSISFINNSSELYKKIIKLCIEHCK